MATYNKLSIGSSGEEVRKLQNALMSAGYDVGSSGADGKFGPSTSAAVKKYQKDMGLSVDGVAGKNTQGALYGNSGNTTGKSTVPSSTGTVRPTTRTTTSKTPTLTYDAAGDQAYQEALKALLEAQKNAPTYANSYEDQLKDLYDRIVNRDKFRYDINQDELYRQYAKQYAEKGRMAMMDTMGQAAALTGGYGSTYGQAVGQQQYDAYLQNLNDVVPELYQLALSRYQMEGDDLKTQYSLLADQYQQEYGQYRDKVGDWQTERNFLSGRYDSERNLDYGMWGDARDFAYTDYRNGIADEQWRRQYEESVRQFNEQMALSREQFAWQQAQAQAAAAAKSSGGGSSSGKSSGKSSNTTSGSYNFGELMDAFASGMSKAQVEAVLRSRGVDVTKDTVQADIRKALSK
jgi:peptidoglycan hydrolase-like protein with peptidoglycan-binding domain